MTPKVPKPKRKLDEAVLETARQGRCIVCGCVPCDPSHIRSRGAGGPDTEWNVVPMCRAHHNEWHAKGWVRFLDLHGQAAIFLTLKGWRIIRQQGVLILHHPEVLSTATEESA